MSLEKGLLCCGATLFASGLSTAFGAASGAIGYGVLRSAGWRSVEFAYTSMVQATTLGGFLLSLPASCCIGTAMAISERVEPLAGGLCWKAISGALSAMLGGSILGVLNNGAQVGFAAAAGATGSVILAGGVLVCIGVGGCCYLVSQSISGEPVAVKIPQDKLTKVDGNTYISVDPATLDVVSLNEIATGAPTTIEELSHAVTEKTGLIITNPSGLIESKDNLVSPNRLRP